MTAGDGCPKSHQRSDVRRRWSKDMSRMDGISWGSEGGEEEAADVTPISSLCLNKSCSRSFYLHMLTGTSEIPGGETPSEKRQRTTKKRKKQLEEPERGGGRGSACV